MILKYKQKREFSKYLEDFKSISSSLLGLGLTNNWFFYYYYYYITMIFILTLGNLLKNTETLLVVLKKFLIKIFEIEGNIRNE